MTIKTTVERLINKEVMNEQGHIVQHFLNQVAVDDLGINAENLTNTFGYDENGEMYEKEVFEWWSVSDWLADKLKEVGSVVLEGDYDSYWGRCETGQGLSLDYDLICVAKKLTKK